MEGLKSLAASRKFWITLLSIAIAGVALGLGKIEWEAFLITVGAVNTMLVLMIGIEDAAKKRAEQPKEPSVTVNTGSPAIVGSSAAEVGREVTKAVAAATGVPLDGPDTRRIKHTPSGGTPVQE